MNNIINNNQSLIIEQAKFIAKSNFIPDHYKNDIGACLLAINSSQASGIPIMQIMSGTYVYKGKLSQYGKFAIALVNKKFNSTLLFEYEYDKDSKPISCQAYLHLKNGKEIRGAKVTREMITAEEWRNNKWKTMPDLMYMYRAGSFFSSTYAPEVLMSGFTEGEAEDIDKSEISPVTKSEADSAVTVKVDDIVKILNSANPLENKGVKAKEPSIEDAKIIQNEMELQRK